jgi:hypothetical protein
MMTALASQSQHRGRRGSPPIFPRGMDEHLAKLCKDFVPGTYIDQGFQAVRKRDGLLVRLLEHRRIPEQGWDDATIERVLGELALMDRYVRE